MKRLYVAFLLSLAASPSRAQAPPDANDFLTGEAEIGLIQKDVDTISSKFLEYRDIPNGIVAPFFRLNGKKDDLRYDLAGQFIQQSDQRYLLRVEKGWLRLDGDYNVIPHRFGNGGKTLEQETGDGVFRIPPTLQQAYQTLIGPPSSSINYTFLNNLVTPALNASPPDVDLALDRERAKLAASYRPGDVDVTLAYFRERRTGDRANAGTSFGFSNVVETPEPIGYLTQDVGADAELAGDWGVARAGAPLQLVPRTTSPASPSTTRSAPRTRPTPAPTRPRLRLHGRTRARPRGPAAGQRGGHRHRRRHRQDRRAQPRRADIALGRWSQDSTNFIPYTTNTAITSPFNAVRSVARSPRRGSTARSTRRPSTPTSTPAPGSTSLQPALPPLRPRQQDDRASRSPATSASTRCGRTSRGSASPTATRTTASTPRSATTRDVSSKAATATRARTGRSARRRRRRRTPAASRSASSRTTG